MRAQPKGKANPRPAPQDAIQTVLERHTVLLMRMVACLEAIQDALGRFEPADEPAPGVTELPPGEPEG